MSHWNEPRPTEPPVDPLGHFCKGINPQPAEWFRCKHCGKWFCRRVGILPGYGESCGELACDLKRDREERHRVMTPEELERYYATAEAYFNRPEEPAGGNRPMKAPAGLSRISAREISRQEFDRAARENDEKMALIEAQKKVWEVDL